MRGWTVTYYTGTNLQKDYTRYYANGRTVQTQTDWYDNPANSIKSHVDYGTGGNKVYEIQTHATYDDVGMENDPVRYRIAETYYYDKNIPKAEKSTIDGFSVGWMCLDYNNSRSQLVDCTFEHTSKDWANLPIHTIPFFFSYTILAVMAGIVAQCSRRS